MFAIEMLGHMKIPPPAQDKNENLSSQTELESNVFVLFFNNIVILKCKVSETMK